MEDLVDRGILAGAGRMAALAWWSGPMPTFPPSAPINFIHAYL
jgi:hypothetical protein